MKMALKIPTNSIHLEQKNQESLKKKSSHTTPNKIFIQDTFSFSTSDFVLNLSPFFLYLKLTFSHLCNSFKSLFLTLFA